ncbi:MAG: YkvA family protein [Spirulinaceae cyanobacterium]
MSPPAKPPNYSNDRFWRKLGRFARVAGKQVVEKALILYYAAQAPETPAWAKTTIYGALAYFILPTDLIPDFVPIAGYGDDLATLAAAVAAVATAITPEIKTQARQKLSDWFGDSATAIPSETGSDRPTPPEESP